MKTHRKHTHSDRVLEPGRARRDIAEEIRTHDEGHELGGILGSSTGEEDHEVIPGGWEGTDDATSTSPSDLCQIPERDFGKEDGSGVTGRASAGGLGRDVGGVSDIKGTPAEDSRNWAEEPIIKV